MTDSLFISDLHLSPERPEMIKLFDKFVDEIAVGVDTLYILGDFLEYWIGDDDHTTGLDPVFAALNRLYEAGTKVNFMHGNRDFLIGQALARRCHFTIINDLYQCNINNWKVLLTHGDLLCTDDISYQEFRRKVRNKNVQRIFLLLPLFVRKLVAKTLRGTSKSATSHKSDTLMDVNQQSVESTMSDTGVDILLHGHTHRPGTHSFELAGRSVKRIVLGDWFNDGNYLRINNKNEFELIYFS